MPETAESEGREPTPIRQGDDPAEAEQALPPGKRRFGRAELLLELGRGGMATLYLARIRGPCGFEKLLAIKKIHDHLAQVDDFVRMFMDEARLAAKIQHPNVVQIFDMGEVDSSFFIAMEYLHGQDLARILRRVIRVQRPEFTWAMASRICADAASGLNAAHELKGFGGRPMNLVHRDVSPQNILVSYDGHVKVADFGIAYAVDRLAPLTGAVRKGKIGYMSPEQVRGEPVDRRSDVFALGVVLWESVCKTRLFGPEEPDKRIRRVMEADVIPPMKLCPEIPSELQGIILKALARRPEDRFQTTEEMRQALDKLLVGEGRMADSKVLADFMEELFGGRRQGREALIISAAGREADYVTRASDIRGATPDHLTVSMPAAVRGLSSGEKASGAGYVRRTILSAVLGSVVGGAMMLLLVYLLVLPRLQSAGTRTTKEKEREGVSKKKEPSSPASAGSSASASASPARRNTVRMRVEVHPGSVKATIQFRGEEYRTNLLVIVVPPESTPEMLYVEAPGYAPFSQKVMINGTEPVDLKIRLKPDSTSSLDSRGKEKRKNHHRRRRGRSRDP